MLVAFGEGEEFNNAKRKLEQVGLKDWNDIINRKNRIDALVLTKKDYNKKDLKKDYDALMYMTEDDFNTTIEQRLRQEKDSKYNAVVRKLGSSDVLDAVSDKMDEFRKINMINRAGTSLILKIIYN